MSMLYVRRTQLKFNEAILDAMKSTDWCCRPSGMLASKCPAQFTQRSLNRALDSSRIHLPEVCRTLLKVRGRRDAKATKMNGKSMPEVDGGMEVGGNRYREVSSGAEIESGRCPASAKMFEGEKQQGCQRRA